MRAQSDGGDVQVSGGISTASFTTPEGKIQVHVSADAAPGDTISGVVLAEPAGKTPQEQQANLGTLTGLVVELEGQRTKVASKQYEWTVPAALRVGRAILTLRRPDGRMVSQVPVPIDPQPPLPRGPGQTGVALPSDLQIGRPVTIRGRFDGSLRGKSVDVGGSPAELLAASPRQVVFRTSQTTFGEVPIRFTDNGQPTEAMTRAMGVRLTATSTQLVKGQRANLTTTVTGLGGITEPVTLTFRNLSPTNVQIEGGSPRITIAPRDVKGDGTYVDTRRLTGIQAGGFQIVASVSRPALSRFNVTRTIDTVVDAWELRARFRIAPDARQLIQRSVLEAQRSLEDFLRQQEISGADPQSVFQALLSHYCYDLRDNLLSSARPTATLMTHQPVMLAAMRQQPCPPGGSDNQRGTSLVVHAVPVGSDRPGDVAVDRLPVRHLHTRARWHHHRRPAEERADQPSFRHHRRHSRGASRAHVEALPCERRHRRPPDERRHLRIVARRPGSDPFTYENL